MGKKSKVKQVIQAKKVGKVKKVIKPTKGGKAVKKVAVAAVKTAGKINQQEKGKIRAALLDERQRLLGDVNRLQEDNIKRSVRETSGALSGDPSENVDEENSRSFSMAIAANKQEALQEIDAALDRIDEGTYGLCEFCGEKIPQKRILAKPSARTCLKCAEQIEAERRE
jgi:RNA polymerase-binding protein DksA